MNPKQWRDLYLGEFKPDPFHALTNEQLRLIRNNRFNDDDTRKRAKNILIERDQKNEHHPKS